MATKGRENKHEAALLDYGLCPSDIGIPMPYNLPCVVLLDDDKTRAVCRKCWRDALRLKDEEARDGD